MSELTSVEICAGAGGQALGLEQAGFGHEAAIEIDPDACETLRRNRGGEWKIIEDDVANIDGHAFAGVDLLAGGVPCPPFSIAGKQLGSGDDRDLFPEALRLTQDIRPRAVLLENVRGLATARFCGYRAQVLARLRDLGYQTWWNLVNARDHGVPQLRPRFVLVAVREPWASSFRWPQPLPGLPPTVGEALAGLMGARGWPGATGWAAGADAIAPTIVGGSKKHGGPDLGPTRARAAWRELGVDGLGIADQAPGQDHPADAMPKLTVRMVARLQGFPDDWQIAGRKTAAYRQVGNAFPPPVARALGAAIAMALGDADRPGRQRELGLGYRRHHRARSGLMRPDIAPGGVFPDYELTDHAKARRRLSELQGIDPMILVLSRGGYCPKDHQQHIELVANYPKLAVAYTQLVTISTDNIIETNEFRASVGAQWTFLSDPGRHVQKDLDIAEYTDPHHDPMIPHTLVLKPGLVIYSVYNGYWFWGRPSMEDLRRDLREVTRQVRPDWDLGAADLRAAWEAGDHSQFYPYKNA